MKKEKLTIRNDKGEEKSYDILFTFDSTDDSKRYVVYTLYEKDESGDIITYASYYYTNDKTRKLNVVEDEKDLKFISEVIDNIEKDVRNNN